jgi:Tfp pilus assembly protein PilF/2-polyprenyl-3-methyl-5-hydroxy-6-metoxy-1,4-benzoquinol methylase
MPVELQNLMRDAVWHHQAGRFADAERIYRQVLAVMPDSGAALNNLGDALCVLGRADEAEACFRQALMLSPGDAEAHNNLGALLFEMGRADAETSFRTALTLNPDHVQAHANLGAVLHSQQRLAEAEASYRRALALNPDMVFAAVNLAAALWEQSKLAEAATLYSRVLKKHPQDGESLCGLAAVTLALDDPAKALTLIRQALAIQETPKARRIFTDIVKQLRWTGDDPQIRGVLARAIAHAWTRPRDLAFSAAGLIKHGGMKPDDPLLLSLLVSTQNTDMELERFLTAARRTMLDGAGAENSLEFQSALAQQCFINEYVFFRGEEETTLAEKRRDELSAALQAGQSVTPTQVLTVAAYFPLARVQFSEKLLETKWPAAVEAVITQQLREPKEEDRLRVATPQLTPIEDKVSQSVRAHYEENPYPRWLRPAPADRKNTVAHYLRQAFPLAQFSVRDGAVQWLSAGCGTGQLATESALGLDAEMLAVDLSLASLGYARRKAEEFRLSNIRFAQADILTLGRSGQAFDVIESSGVLHHMAEPFAGWRALLHVLKPGGVMLVALYSRLARRNVERTRQFIAERGYGVSAEAIRQCRQDLLALPEGENFVTASSSDFFGISTCRDLLFHGQEAQLDLGQIGGFLKENRLSLLGFEVGSDVLYAYRQRFPDDPAAVNLEHWQAFETDHPDTFAAMYIFWVQKAG